MDRFDHRRARLDDYQERGWLATWVYYYDCSRWESTSYSLGARRQQHNTTSRSV